MPSLSPPRRALCSAAGLKSFVEAIGGCATVKQVLTIFDQAKSPTFRNMVRHHRQYENGVVGQNVVASISSSSMAIDVKDNPKVNFYCIFTDEAVHIKEMMKNPASQHDKRIHLQGWTMGTPFTKKDQLSVARAPPDPHACGSRRAAGVRADLRVALAFPAHHQPHGRL